MNKNIVGEMWGFEIIIVFLWRIEKVLLIEAMSKKKYISQTEDVDMVKEHDGNATIRATTRRTQRRYRRSTYDDVMSYLYSMTLSPEVKENVGRRLVQEVTEPALAEAFAQIDQMMKLRNGWAGKGSYAVSPTVLKNLKQVLLISGNEDWTEWTISPDVNATVGLQSKNGHALISLGVCEFSYFSDKNGEEQGESHIPFSADSFLHIMRKIV